MIHATKGVVLRTVAYGETSLICTLYTELFGMQSYIVKGVRQRQRKGANKAAYFQPGAILDLEVYHTDGKNLQYIRSYHWGYVYAQLYSSIVRHSVALYMVELLLHSLKQPEGNPELYYLLENSLLQADKALPAVVANLPLYFTLHLGTELGFQLQGSYSTATPVLDMLEGRFAETIPQHPHYLTGTEARASSEIGNAVFYESLATVALSRHERRKLLLAYQQYIALHVAEFAPLRSVEVLQEVLG